MYGGVPEQVVEHCLSNFDIIMSEEGFEELKRHLKLKTTAPYKWRRELGISLRRVVAVVPTGEPFRILRDPDDEHVIKAALEQGCQYIVSGDKDLTELHRYRGITILKPVEFLELINE